MPINLLTWQGAGRWCLEHNSCFSCCNTDMQAQFTVQRCLLNCLPDAMQSICISALQVSLPDWPGRLPLGLTQLVVSPLAPHGFNYPVGFCTTLLRVRLPKLRSLRHLAFHGLQEIGDSFLPELCTAIAGAMPQLVSLHLVRMPLFLPSLLSS